MSEVNSQTKHNGCDRVTGREKDCLKITLFPNAHGQVLQLSHQVRWSECSEGAVSRRTGVGVCSA